jgi:hypothetical protein
MWFRSHIRPIDLSLAYEKSIIDPRRVTDVISLIFIIFVDFGPWKAAIHELQLNCCSLTPLLSINYLARAAFVSAGHPPV